MLTIAYIGNGKSANRYHMPFSRQLKDIKIKTIFSPTPSPWEPIPGVVYTDKIENVLEDPDIQLVVLSVPPSAHYSLAKQCLLAGKNTLVEKPFTETAAEAKELFSLAKEKGLFIQAYQNRRFDSDFLTVQKIIDSCVLGDILEVEMHFDYFRPEIPENIKEYSINTSYLYGHACHTIDQVLSYFGMPKSVHYDVRQLLGKGRMNDYFDLDFYYRPKKVSIKSSYFRIKERPSFVVYGKKGMFIKESKDRQEDDLKRFYMPTNPDFGMDSPEHYGTLTYIDDHGLYHEEKVISEVGNYARMYQAVHDSIVLGKEKVVKDEETIRQIEIIEEGIRHMNQS
ncbi:oxidoreductase [Streptococcus pseudoporcinus]|uniref:Oxidoreductase n=1 Tax=Streptococcus pseudoporcinus TaxID=361101 RepID=A0A4U9YGR0_9STRE|nr:Gfo/Idh/MocA family oxidoreductase [Streptococcus pseudoporcinus]VTS25512.1 oxidoreductase [Streptococcus pseudoporcinus]